MSMEITLLDFQLSTENQTGLRTKFFFFSEFPWNVVYICFRGLRVYWHCPFSCVTENEAMVAILIFLIKKINNK